MFEEKNKPKALRASSDQTSSIQLRKSISETAFPFLAYSSVGNNRIDNSPCPCRKKCASAFVNRTMARVLDGVKSMRKSKSNESCGLHSLNAFLQVKREAYGLKDGERLPEPIVPKKIIRKKIIMIDGCELRRNGIDSFTSKGYNIQIIRQLLLRMNRKMGKHVKSKNRKHAKSGKNKKKLYGRGRQYGAGGGRNYYAGTKGGLVGGKNSSSGRSSLNSKRKYRSGTLSSIKSGRGNTRNVATSTTFLKNQFYNNKSTSVSHKNLKI